MIDIHSHILPNLDDGPKTVNQALSTLLKAHQQGVTAIFATPHSMDGVYQTTLVDIMKYSIRLNVQLKKNNIPLKIFPGSEIRLTHDTVDLYDKHQLMTLNNSKKYILIELPPMFIIDGITRVINQLSERGLTTIIAHPERNRSILKNLNIISKLIYAGTRLQLTAESLLGGFGRQVKSVSEKMIKNDVVSFIASDSHPGRPYRMKQAFEKTTQMVGLKTAEKLFIKNPGEILQSAEKGMNYGR